MTADPDIARLIKSPDFQGLFKGVRTREDAVERLTWILGNQSFDQRRRMSAAMELAGLDSRAAFEPLVGLYRDSYFDHAQSDLTDTAASLLYSIVRKRGAELADDDLLSIANVGEENHEKLRRIGTFDDRFQPPRYRLRKVVDQEGARRGLWEKGQCQVILVGVGPAKIGVLKETRALTGLGLEEAKHLVDHLPAPVLESVKAERAEAARERLERAGATVEVRSPST